jgi:hypothetical protein
MAGIMAELDINLRRFDMRKIPQDAVCVFIGRRRTGKSTLVRDLLFHHQDMPLGTVISGTEESNSFYGKMIPPLFIHGEYNPVILANYVKRQKMIMAKIMAEQEAGQTRSRYDPRSFMILDDCMYDDSWTHDKNIRYLFMNGRWLKVFFLITMQYPLGIQPALRTNVDFVFILREPYMSNRKRIFDNYCSVFPSFEFFCQIMDQCTQNYECLVIDNTSQSSKLEDCVFYYKAEIHNEPFRIGAPEFWAHSAQHLRQREEEQGQQNYNSAKKLKGPAISVRKV